MIKLSDRTSIGEYNGTVLVPFPTRQWFRNTCLRSCLLYFILGVAVISIFVMAAIDIFPYNIPLWYISNICLVFVCFYSKIFRSFMRIDFFQEEIRLCRKVLFFNNYHIIRMRRKNVRSELKTPTLLTLKNVFDPTGRSKAFKISDKLGWDKDSLSLVKNTIQNATADSGDSSLLQLTGSYVGSIVAEPSRFKSFFYTFIPRFLLSFSLAYLDLIFVGWDKVLLATVLLLLASYDLFIVVNRVDVNEGEILFLGKEKVIGTSRGFIADAQKIEVQDTRDIFRVRMLKIKVEGSFFPICFSKRLGWTDEKLDEVKQAISQIQCKNQ